MSLNSKSCKRVKSAFYLDECLGNLLGCDQEIYHQRRELLALPTVCELTEVSPVVVEVLRIVNLVAQSGVELKPMTEVN